MILTVSLLLFTAFSVSAQEFDYGIIIDAGSSGSRVHVYAWDEGSWKAGSDTNLPEITEVFNKRIKPGISSFAGDLTGIDVYMGELVDETKVVIPSEKHHETSIYLLTTAGMRLLEEDDANDIINAINDFLTDPDVSPFAYNHLNTRILSGEEEGVFAWISANYLRGFFDRNAGVRDYGVLEMGGASTQIAFLHDGSILADKFPVTIRGQIFPLYVHSYLGFGLDQVEGKTRSLAVQMEAMRNGFRINPCLLNGDFLNATVDGQHVMFVGTGDPDKCLEYSDEIVYEAELEDRCLPKPCAIGTVYQPSVDDDMSFYAISSFFFGLDRIDTIPGNVLDPDDGSYVIANARQAAMTYCAMNITDVERELDSYDSTFNSLNCLNALYGTIIMEQGFGLSTTNRQVHAASDINGVSLKWVLGAIIYETERTLEEESREVIINEDEDEGIDKLILWSVVGFSGLSVLTLLCIFVARECMLRRVKSV